MSAGRSQAGQALPLVAGIVVVAAVLVAAVGWYAGGLVDSARARTAADAAALAGALDGSRRDAELAAQSNGGTLESFALVGVDVIVAVRVGRAVQRARATAGGARLSTLGSRDRPSG